EAPSSLSGIAAVKGEAQPAYFYAAFVDPTGNPVEFPGIGNILKITSDSLSRIRKADDFVDQLRTCSADYSQSFTFDGEFDVYPILMVWLPSAESADFAQFAFNSFSFDANGAPVEEPPCTLLLFDDECPPDQGVMNMVSGFWHIENFSDVLARYDPRPLAL